MPLFFGFNPATKDTALPTGSVAVRAYWHDGNKDSTIHAGGPWEGERKENDEYLFRAFGQPARMGDVELVGIYAFWNPASRNHTFHEKPPWEGEDPLVDDATPSFYALPVSAASMDQSELEEALNRLHPRRGSHVGLWGLNRTTLPCIPSLRQALDVLLGPDTWKDPFVPQWGHTYHGYFPATFPAFSAKEYVDMKVDPKAEPEWKPVNFWVDPETPGWHCDYLDVIHDAELGCDYGLVVVVLFSNSGPGDGGTVLVPGSHRWVEQYITSRRKVPHRQLKAHFAAFIEEQRAREPSESPFALRLPWEVSDRDQGPKPIVLQQMKGEAGNIILMHRYLLHTGSQNISRGRHPRIMTNVTVQLKEPVRI